MKNNFKIIYKNQYIHDAKKKYASMKYFINNATDNILIYRNDINVFYIFKELLNLQSGDSFYRIKETVFKEGRYTDGAQLLINSLEGWDQVISGK